MSYSSQGYYSSQNGNPPSGKPGGGGYGGEDPPQSGKRRQQQRQHQQASPVRVPSSSGFHQKDHYPGSHYSSLPGYQSSHNQPGEQHQPQGEEPPQSGKSRHQKQQQQASPVRGPSSGNLPENNNPDKQSSHQRSQYQPDEQRPPGKDPPQSGKSRHQKKQQPPLPPQQQASPVRVLPQGNLPENKNPDDEQQPPGVPINPKDNDLSNHQTPNQPRKQVTSIQDPSPLQSLPNDSSSSTYRLPSESPRKIQEELRNPQESSVENCTNNPNLTSFALPANNHGGKHHSHTNNETTLQPALAEEANSKVDQNRNSHALKEPLPIPDGYPPNRSPTSPSKLEPRPKKGCLEKICCCCFCCF